MSSTTRSDAVESHASAWTTAAKDFAGHLDRTGQPSPQTIERYSRRVETFGHTLSKSPWTLDADTLAAELDSRNWSQRTRSATLVALRRFYAWAITAGRVDRSPLAGIPDAMPKRPGPLTLEPRDRWREPLRDYLRILRAAGRRPATITLNRNHLTMLSYTFADPWRVGTDDLARFLSRDDWAPEYRRSIRGSVQRFYRWAVATGRLDRDPTLALATVKVPRALPRPAPDAAVLEAFENADLRVRLAIELGMYAGLRIAEVAALAEADATTDRVRVTGKGGHHRFVPLHPTLAATLSAERSRRAENGERSPWIFPSTRGGHLSARHLGRLVSQSLPGTWTHHTLRHRFATQAYAAERDLRAVQELLGHMRPETTARYAAVPADALRSAVAGVGLTLDVAARAVGP